MMTASSLGHLAVRVVVSAPTSRFVQIVAIVTCVAAHIVDPSASGVQSDDNASKRLQPKLAAAAYSTATRNPRSGYSTTRYNPVAAGTMSADNVMNEERMYEEGSDIERLLQSVLTPVKYGVARPLPPGTGQSDLLSLPNLVYMLSMPPSAVVISATTHRNEYGSLVCIGMADNTQSANHSPQVKLRILDISGSQGQTWRTVGFINFTGIDPKCMAEATENFLPALTSSPSKNSVFIFGLGVYDECAVLFSWSSQGGLEHVQTNHGSELVPHLYHALASQNGSGGTGADVHLVAFGGKFCLHVDKAEKASCVLNANGTNTLWELEIKQAQADLPSWKLVDVSEQSPKPEPRYSADMFAVNSSTLVMYGGFAQSDYSSTPLCDLWLFDRVSQSWEMMANLTADCEARSRCVNVFPVAVKQLAVYSETSGTLVVVVALCQSSDYTVYSIQLDGKAADAVWTATEKSSLTGNSDFSFFYDAGTDTMTKLALASVNDSLYLVENNGLSTHRLVFDRSSVSPDQPTGTASAALLDINDAVKDQFVGNWGCVASRPVTLPMPAASQCYDTDFARRVDVHSFLLGGMCGNGHGDVPAAEQEVMPVWTLASLGDIDVPTAKVFYTKNLPAPGPLFGQRMGHTTVYQAADGVEVIALFGGGLAKSIVDYSYVLAPPEVWCFNINTYEWVLSGAKDGPSARLFHVSFPIHSTSFAVYGGTTQPQGVFSATNDFWVFTFSDLGECAGNWTDLTLASSPPLPQLYGHALSYYRENPIVFGGGNSGTHCCMSNLLFTIHTDVENSSVSWRNLSFDSTGPPVGRRFHTLSPYTNRSFLVMGNHSKPYERLKYYTTTELFLINSDAPYGQDAVTVLPFFTSHVTFFMQKAGGYLLGGRTTFENSKRGDAGEKTFVYGNQYATLDYGMCPLGRESVAGECELCPNSSYSSTLNLNCSSCVNGTLTRAPGAIEVNACFAPDPCIPDPCHGHGSCKNKAGRAQCFCDPGYMPETMCYLPIYFLIAGFIALLLLLIVLTVARKYHRSRRETQEKQRQLRASRKKITELTRVWEIQWHQLTMREKMAAGGFGEVWLAELSDMLVAVKHLKQSSLTEPASVQDFRREVELMQTLRHPNIVLFLGAGSSGSGHLFIVMEYLKRGALRNLIRDTSTPLDYSDKLRFALDAAKGMSFLHGSTPPRIHRDLKSSNLLVSDKWVVKVADFGTARLVETLDKQQPVSQEMEGLCVNIAVPRDERTPLLQGEGYLSGAVGTSLWQSPEMMLRKEYGASTDVYSFGIVLYEIFFRKRPFVEREDFRFYSVLTDAVVSGYRPDVSEDSFGDDVPVEYVMLMEHCWKADPSSRPTFADIVNRLQKLSSV
eukprot:scpid16651/ scgid4929/ Probable serine/threonine-protein kinase drkA; Receptor-like kinase 1; Receptor-like kinase A; Vesicle-associated receptor tyrosine kinase-like protein 1